MNSIIGKTTDKRNIICKLTMDNIEKRNAQDIVNGLGMHFGNIGSNYANKIENSEIIISDYLRRIPQNQKSLF